MNKSYVVSFFDPNNDKVVYMTMYNEYPSVGDISEDLYSFSTTNNLNDGYIKTLHVIIRLVRHKYIQ